MSVHAAQASQPKPIGKVSLFGALALFRLPYVASILILWDILSLLLGQLGIKLAVLNVASLLLILIACIGAFGYLARSSRARLWHPITWFLLTSALYYGFGPLLYYFGKPETIDFVDGYYPVGDDGIFRDNSVILAGVALVILIYLLISRIAVFRKDRSFAGRSTVWSRADDTKLLKVAYFFLTIGFPVKLAIALPYAIGQLDWVVPGSITNIGNFVVLALIPLYLVKDRSLKNKLLFIALAAFCLITALVTLSKLAVLLVILTIFLAAALKGSSLIRLGLMGLLTLLLYAAVLSPLISYGRAAFNVAGLQDLNDVGKLSEDMWQDKSSEYLSDVLPGVQGWWARLNYANAQAFAIKGYDSGQQGDSIYDILWVLVPREVYPDKPILSRDGTDFNVLVTGNPHSSSAPGMIAEGYWNLGWYGVGFVCFIMALFYWGWEKYNDSQLMGKKLQFLPVIFMGLMPALTQDSWFVIGTFGIVPIAIATHWLIRLSFAMLRLA